MTSLNWGFLFFCGWILFRQGDDVSCRGISSFIMNGEEAEKASIPHQLQLQWRRNFQWKSVCGAVLIGRRSALTAAHCAVEAPEPSRLRLVAGLHSIDDKNSTQISGIAKITVHPNYSDGQAFLSNDVAILHLTDALVFDRHVKPIALNRDQNESFEGHLCTLSGWGETHYSYRPTVLQKVDMKIINNSQCASILTSFPEAVIYRGHICAFDPPKASCGGDSGGPMTCTLNGKPILAGISSWNIRTPEGCNDLYPSVYSRMSFFSTWIDGNTP